MTLDDGDIERIAARVVELLRDEQDRVAARAVRLADAATVARILGVDRDWVYAHARQLGAIRLGGPHGRLRFDLDTMRERLAEPPAPAALRTVARRSRRGPWPSREDHLESGHSRKQRPGGAQTPPARHREVGPDA